jgi:hypothetical protein
MSEKGRDVHVHTGWDVHVHTGWCLVFGSHSLAFGSHTEGTIDLARRIAVKLNAGGKVAMFSNPASFVRCLIVCICIMDSAMKPRFCHATGCTVRAVLDRLYEVRAVHGRVYEVRVGLDHFMKFVRRRICSRVLLGFACCSWLEVNIRV